MSFINWLRGVKAKVDIEPIADGNVILQDNGDGTARLFADVSNSRLPVSGDYGDLSNKPEFVVVTNNDIDTIFTQVFGS